MLRDFYRRMMRLGLTAGALLAGLVLGPALSLPLIGSLLVGGVGAWVARRSLNTYFDAKDAAEADGLSRSEARTVGRQAALRRGGWKQEGLPLDMTCDFVDGRRALFGAAGIDGLIRGERGLLSGEKYSFDVPDIRSAERLQSFLSRSDVSGSVTRSEDGRFEVSSSSLEDINTLAKEAFPKVRVEVEREVVRGCQYIVDGAASYEEAVERFRSDPSTGRYLGSYYSIKESLDGEVLPLRMDGTKVDAAVFPDGMKAGSYIVSEEEVTKVTGQMAVPANIAKEDYGEFANMHFSSRSPGVSVESFERLEDGTPEGVGRYFVKDVDGHPVALRDPGDPKILAEDGLKGYVLMPSEEQVTEFVNRGTLPEGTFVSVSAEPPRFDGEHGALVELDLQDKRVLAAVACGYGELPASVQAAMDRYGVDPDTLSYSCLVDKVRREGSAGLFLVSGLDEETVAESRFNGLRFSELEERLTSEDRLPLSYAKALEWSREAAEINYVNLEIDIGKMEMRISSSVGDGSTMKVERYPITDKDIESLSKRGAISKAESKELLMQLHPDYFRTFSDGKGQSVLEDPLGAFFRGEKPALKKDAKPVKGQEAAQKQERKRTLENKPPRTARKPKMGI